MELESMDCRRMGRGAPDGVVETGPRLHVRVARHPQLGRDPVDVHAPRAAPLPAVRHRIAAFTRRRCGDPFPLRRRLVSKKNRFLLRPL